MRDDIDDELSLLLKELRHLGKMIAIGFIVIGIASFLAGYFYHLV